MTVYGKKVEFGLVQKEVAEWVNKTTSEQKAKAGEAWWNLNKRYAQAGGDGGQWASARLVSTSKRCKGN